MARKPNSAIGTCPCPISGCKREKAPIYRFAKRSARPDPQGKAGKFYGRCPEHGWFGFDGAAAIQTHIREHGTLNQGETWDAENQAAPPSSSSEPQPPKEKHTPAPKPAPKPSSAPPAPEKRKHLWDL